MGFEGQPILAPSKNLDPYIDSLTKFDTLEKCKVVKLTSQALIYQWVEATKAVKEV
jgi:hypothetical protein